MFQSNFRFYAASHSDVEMDATLTQNGQNVAGVASNVLIAELKSVSFFNCASTQRWQNLQYVLRLEVLLLDTAPPGCKMLSLEFDIIPASLDDPPSECPNSGEHWPPALP